MTSPLQSRTLEGRSHTEQKDLLRLSPYTKHAKHSLCHLHFTLHEDLPRLSPYMKLTKHLLGIVHFPVPVEELAGWHSGVLYRT